MFVPVLAAARARKAERSRRRQGAPRPRMWGAAGAALSAGLAPLAASLFHGAHGGATAAGVIVVLLSTAVGFGAARVIGRELKS